MQDSTSRDPLRPLAVITIAVILPKTKLGQ
jgi:hypothetical protein